ncbi:CGNR zinc finger domain-containing protein [Streptomyces sp. H39-S7]|uniref:CGNR zinc finger domain-containing protein n=1 Tax=Streptomyces sp. H39-S7 TaxID=3004357 RepID=UPI0022B074F3|nr:CGNR zinc finger domain-containing protein [Streptomyces sp. H39-S7]MCZ4124509.1 CGNR zinc finger domain-containing protein [Streptomyces sp. H39-S7]
MIEAPPSAQLVEAFANTVDVELGTDDLDAPGRLAAWLADRGLLETGSTVSAADHDLCLRLRAGIREELGVHVGDTPDPDLSLAADEALRELPLLSTVRRGPSAALLPAPELPPARRALALIAVAWTELVVTGDADRLKRCAEHACAWVFWDVSRNRSRRWCSMRVCGNRTKARRYAARHAATAG